MPSGWKNKQSQLFNMLYIKFRWELFVLGGFDYKKNLSLVQADPLQKKNNFKSAVIYIFQIYKHTLSKDGRGSQRVCQPDPKSYGKKGGYCVLAV